MPRYARAAGRFARARARYGSALGREGIDSRPSRSPPANFASPRARDGSRCVVHDKPEFVKAVPSLRSAAPATVQAWTEVGQVTPEAVKGASWSGTPSRFGQKAPREAAGEHFATVTCRIQTVRRRIES